MRELTAAVKPKALREGLHKVWVKWQSGPRMCWRHEGEVWWNRNDMSAHVDKSEVSAAPKSENLPKPHLNADGTLVIPMLADPKYHWWKQGGQTVRKTMEELQSPAGEGGQ